MQLLRAGAVRVDIRVDKRRLWRGSVVLKAMPNCEVKAGWQMARGCIGDDTSNAESRVDVQE